MSWLAGAGSLLQAGSSIFGGLLGASGQAAANAQQQAQFEQTQAGHAMEYWNNQDQAWKFQRDNQDFAERMSSSAYQRATQDMVKAGLNPILAYQQGGANTPTSSGSPAGSPGMPGMSSFGNAMAPLASSIASAGQAATTFANLKQLGATTDKTHADTDKVGTEADLNRATTGLTQSQDAVAKAQKSVTDAMVDKTKQDTATSAAQAAAAHAAARNNDADTTNKAVQNLILQQDATTAKAKAENAKYFGGGYFGDAVGTAARTTSTAVDQTVGAYSKYIGQPFSDFVHNIYNRFKGKP